MIKQQMSENDIQKKPVVNYVAAKEKSKESKEEVKAPNNVDVGKYYVTGKQLIEMDIKELPTLIDPILPKYGVVGIAGSSDTGKSSFLRHLAVSIVNGEETFLDFKINATHRKGIYVSTEDDDYIMSHLLIKQKKGEDCNSYDNLMYIFNTDNLENKLDQILSKIKVDFVIIDAISDLLAGDFNSVGNIRNYLHKFRNIAYKHRTLVIFLHHTGKRTEERAPSKHNLVGSQGFESKMRVVMELKKDNNGNNIRHLCIVKGNYIKEELKIQSFALEFLEDMTFKNTGKHVAFEDLSVKNTEDPKKDEAVKYAFKLKSEGFSQSAISEKIKTELKYIKVSKSTIGYWFEKYKDPNAAGVYSISNENTSVTSSEKDITTTSSEEDTNNEEIK